MINFRRNFWQNKLTHHLQNKRTNKNGKVSNMFFRIGNRIPYSCRLYNWCHKTTTKYHIYIYISYYSIVYHCWRVCALIIYIYESTPPIYLNSRGKVLYRILVDTMVFRLQNWQSFPKTLQFELCKMKELRITLSQCHPSFFYCANATYKMQWKPT